MSNLSDMEKKNLNHEEWRIIRKLARKGRLPVGKSTIDKIKAGERNWTDRIVLAIHKETSGDIPCWRLIPRLWAEGQIPPAIYEESEP